MRGQKEGRNKERLFCLMLFFGVRKKKKIWTGDQKNFWKKTKQKKVAANILEK
jgi:hypothetical protein